MPVEKTPRAVVLILDSENKVTGYEIENFLVFNPAPGEEDLAKLFAPRMVREESTEADVNALLGVSSELLTDRLKEIGAQNAQLQTDAANALASAQDAVNAANTRVEVAERAATRATDILVAFRAQLDGVLGEAQPT